MIEIHQINTVEIKMWFLLILLMITHETFTNAQNDTYAMCAEWMGSYQRHGLSNGVYNIRLIVFLIIATSMHGH